MKKCYNFIGSEKHGKCIARLSKDKCLTHDEVFDYLIQKNDFPGVLEIGEEQTRETFIWHDYMYNEFALYIMSEKLKKFIERRMTLKDDISWIPVTVKNCMESRKYFIIKFNALPDVLDYTNSSFNPVTNSLLVPCIDVEKASCYSVFPLRMANNFFPSLLYTTEELMKELKKENFSNLVFEKSKTSEGGIVIK